ncbi:MAG: M3 family oligoendopeptidase [Candidatus Cloacimonetes bacterium]|nr:M3 family oligoendopeptidase [Candidatus Cloacimonadota bacterium]
MDYTNETIKKPKRRYFPENLNLTDWNELEKHFLTLVESPINSPEELIQLLEKSGELNDILREESALRYIKMTCFADQEKYEKAFNSFYSEIIAKTQPFSFELEKKFYNSPYRKELSEDKFAHLNRIISNSIELYREENIPLFVKEQELASKYGAINSKLTVNYKGEEKTLSQLSVFLKNQDRSVREEVWYLRVNRIQEVSDELNVLFDEMKEIRLLQAKNAGFQNYRDYKHQSMGRFSYTPEDIFKFHDAIEKHVLPFLKERNEYRRTKLGIDTVRPWDTSVDLDGKMLKPFSNIEEFIDKALKILNRINPEYALRLNKMKNSKLLDLDNRKGKAPGGYNYPLAETGAPFIFMNAVGLHRDVVTLLHESGHAMHTFASNHIKIDPYKETPSEVAELASIAMEFISMDYWSEFYPDKDDLRKARLEQLEGSLSFLPWCMIVDAFQQWIYTNPNHTATERHAYFESLMDRFGSGVDWSGLENYKSLMWLFQLHIFEVPFYYIEYGISQLGAMAIYRNYRKSGKEKALSMYDDFLKLGYSKPVDKIYETAGIKFDFSEGYIRELVDFIREEMNK